eukprot:TRINITY_DN2725_c0_g4_i1.p1 TRINITY_DN2725_c0_g4~~TRINITY_DN2725_c0_g4_i1.p1  ORF type:complete len:963 (+),score=130.85 TRINITY_DN2725_c0_g4_i1:104-2992(+)
MSLQASRNRCRACGRKQLIFVCLVLVVTVDTSLAIALLLYDFLVFVALSCCRLILLLLGGVLAVKCGSGAWTCERHGTFVLSPSAREVELPLATNDQLGFDESLAAQRATNAEVTKHKWKASAALVTLFLLVTAHSVYTGIHIITTTGLAMVPAVLLCVSVFCMNIEFLLLKRYVDKYVDDGVLLPGLHEHPLQFKSKVSLAWCSVCRQRVGPLTGGYEAFCCDECDTGAGKGAGKGASGFVVCIVCYQKQMLRGDVQEGLLRGDKGPKPSPDLAPAAYVKRTLKLVAPFKANFAAAIVCVFAAQLTQVALPKYQGSIINAVIAAERLEFHRMLVTFAVLSVVSALFSCLKTLTVNIVARQVSLGVRSDIFKSVIRQDMAFFDGIMTGQLTSRMTNDAVAVTSPIQQLMNRLLANLITLFGGFFMCLSTSWKLTMLALTLIGPVIYITGMYARWSKEINKSVRASLGDANASATESLKNIRTVRAFGADEVEIGVVDGYFAQAWANMRKDAFASASVSAITDYVNFSASVMVYWYGGEAVLGHTDDQLSIGTLVTFNLYWNMLRNSITSLNGMLNSLIVATSAAKRVFEVIDLVPDIDINDPGAVPLDQLLPRGRVPSIEFHDVSFTYQMRPDSLIFRGLCFKIHAGTTAAFVGKSGCGKSTVMSLLMRFYDPQEGIVLLEGRPLAEYNLRSYQRRIGLVSQETQVFARSVRENLVYGIDPNDYSDDKIEWAARQANAHEFIMSMDRGYDSMLGESGCRLSGGQKQRLSIARAFLRRPQLLLLDEATSALDAENEEQIQEALDDMVKAMTGSCSIIMIAHRLSTVMGVDKIIVIDEGHVHEEGTHAELMSNDQIYAGLVRRQQAPADDSWRQGRHAEEEDDGKEGKQGKVKAGKKGKWRGREGYAKGKGDDVPAVDHRIGGAGEQGGVSSHDTARATDNRHTGEMPSNRSGKGKGSGSACRE